MLKHRQECEVQVKGFKSSQFKKFETREEAENFVNVANPCDYSSGYGEVSTQGDQLAK